jgi:hypothetical protein
MNPAPYPPLDCLFDLACRDGVDIRPTLLRVITDLYVQKPVHSPEEEIQYIELALGLIAAADEPTRAAVVTSLSRYPNAPAAILHKLSDYAVVAPAANPASSAVPPAQSEAGTDDLVDMFFAADADERRLILTTLDAVGEVATCHPVPVANDVIGRLETAALQHNLSEFSRTLARALGINGELAERVTRDHSGEPIVVAAKAIGMKAAVLQRILLFVNPAIGQSVPRVHELARLFEEITLEAAHCMLEIWQTGAKASRPMHRPVHWDDERRPARSLPTAARHRSSRSDDEQTPRSRKSGR